MDIKELIERVRLTDEEISVAIIQAVPFPNTHLGERRVIAQAQLNKVLNDPDLYVIDKKKQRLDCSFLAPGECMVDERRMEINCPLPHRGYKQVIPLREAIKEVKK